MLTSAGKGPSRLASAASTATPSEPPTTLLSQAEAIGLLSEALSASDNPAFTASDDDARQALAEKILQHLNNGQLALDQLADIDGSNALVMPLAAWRALADIARRLQGKDISSVELPKLLTGTDLDALIGGLNTLGALSDLGVIGPRFDTVLDLARLQTSAPALHVRLKRPGDDLTTVRVPAKAEVHLSASAGVTSNRIRVHYPGVDSKATRVVDLQAAPYFRGVDAVPGVLGLQLRATTASHNLRAHFARDPLRKHDLPEDAIACRHLTMHWIAMRQAHHQARAVGGTARFSYQTLASVDSIAAHVPRDAEARSKALFDRAPTAVFAIDRMGEMLVALFRDMRAGQARHFYISTSRHAMGLELQVSTDATQPGNGLRHSLALFDPNRTTTHVGAGAHRLEEFAAYSLRRLLTVEEFAAYFGDGLHPQAALIEVGDARSSSKALAPTQFFLDAADRLSSQHLLTIMGFKPMAGELSATMQLVLAAPELDCDSRAAVLAAGVGSDPATGLVRACYFGHFDVASRYVQLVVDARPKALTPDQRYDLLKSAVAVSKGDASPAVWWALHANPETVDHYVRAILAASEHQLSALGRASAITARDSNGLPLLSHAVAAFNRYGSLDDPAHQTCISRSTYGYVHEIAVSRQLNQAQKSELLGVKAPDSIERPAQIAMNIDPQLVITMVRAVVDARLGRTETVALLDAMGINQDALSFLLSHTPRGASATWQQLVRRTLKTVHIDMPTGLRHRLTRPSLDDFRQPSPATPPRGTAAMVSGLGIEAHGFRQAAFQVEHADTHRDYVVCSSKRPLDALAPMRLLPGTRMGPDASFTGYRYLVPRTRLQTQTSASGPRNDTKTGPGPTS